MLVNRLIALTEIEFLYHSFTSAVREHFFSSVWENKAKTTLYEALISE